MRKRERDSVENDKRERIEKEKEKNTPNINRASNHLHTPFIIISKIIRSVEKQILNVLD